MVAIPSPVAVDDMKGNEPVPEGRYNLRCEKAEYVAKGKQATSKDPYASCQFVITGPEDQEQYIGRKVFANLMLGGPGMFLTKGFLTGSGEDTSFLLEDTDQLVGREAGSTVLIEKREGYDDRNRIKTFGQVL
jgi:hypothetical protein